MTHCVACHTAKVHWRNDKLATDSSSLKAQVNRWQDNTGLNWSKGLKLDLSPWPNIKAYYERVGQRAKVQETLKAEGLA